MPRHPNAYVRIAKPSELPEITDVLTRAFLDDPTMCYYGSVPVPVKDPANPTPAEQKIIQALHVFQGTMAKMTLLVGGRIDVVVVPTAGGPDANGSDSSKGQAEEPQERIVAVATWLPPGVTLDFKLPTLLRAGIHKVLFAWGLTGARRLGGDYTPAVEGVLTREFAGRKLDRLDSWHVFMIAVDLGHQGSGYSSMLFKEGFRRVAPTPIHLVASKPKNKDIYAHFGFELVETHVVGVGEVGANGIKTDGAAAVGIPEFIMIKWTVEKPE